MSDDRDAPDLSSAAEDELRAQLRGLPRPPIPDDVTERVMAAIKEEAQAREADEVVTPIGRNRWRRIVPIAAAAAVIVLAVAALPAVFSDTDPQPVAAPARCAVGADAGVDLTPVMHASGSGYSADNLSEQAAVVAQRQAGSCDNEAGVVRDSTEDGHVVPPAVERELDSAADAPAPTPTPRTCGPRWTSRTSRPVRE